MGRETDESQQRLMPRARAMAGVIKSNTSEAISDQLMNNGRCQRRMGPSSLLSDRFDLKWKRVNRSDRSETVCEHTHESSITRTQTLYYTYQYASSVENKTHKSA